MPPTEHTDWRQAFIAYALIILVLAGTIAAMLNWPVLVQSLLNHG